VKNAEADNNDIEHIIARVYVAEQTDSVSAASILDQLEQQKCQSTYIKLTDPISSSTIH